MSLQSVMLPVLFQVCLVFGLLGLLAASRAKAMKEGVRAKDITLSDTAFPASARQLSNCYANQFEMPVLFYVVVLFAVVFHHTGSLFVLCEWIFVLCRYGHAFVHTTSNRVELRGPLFLGSAIATAFMWFLVFKGVLFGAEPI